MKTTIVLAYSPADQYFGLSFAATTWWLSETQVVQGGLTCPSECWCQLLGMKPFLIVPSSQLCYPRQRERKQEGKTPLSLVLLSKKVLRPAQIQRRNRMPLWGQGRQKICFANVMHKCWEELLQGSLQIFVNYHFNVIKEKLKSSSGHTGST